ncbi:MAG: hypothetical protein V1663_01995 [archaeon]
MKPWLHKVEIIVDKLVPYIVVLLLFLISGEFFYKTFLEKYGFYVILADYFIIAVFFIDLCFKYYRVRNFKTFLKKYWIDIIAVFPFFLLFRVVEEVYALFRISAEIGEGQKIVHTGVEIEKLVKEEKIIRELRELEQGGKVFKEIEEGTKLTRTSFIARLIRPLERIPRIIKAFIFYEKPIKRDYNIIKENIKKVERTLEKDVKIVEKVIEKDIKKIEKRL